MFAQGIWPVVKGGLWKDCSSHGGSTRRRLGVQECLLSAVGRAELWPALENSLWVLDFILCRCLKFVLCLIVLLINDCILMNWTSLQSQEFYLVKPERSDLALIKKKLSFPINSTEVFCQFSIAHCFVVKPSEEIKGSSELHGLVS